MERKSFLLHILAAPEIITNLVRNTKLTPRQVADVFTHEFWEEITPGERQRLVQLLLEKVTVHPEKIVLEVRTDGLGSVHEAYANQQEKTE